MFIKARNLVAGKVETAAPCAALEENLLAVTRRRSRVSHRNTEEFQTCIFIGCLACRQQRRAHARLVVSTYTSKYKKYMKVAGLKKTGRAGRRCSLLSILHCFYTLFLFENSNGILDTLLYKTDSMGFVFYLEIENVVSRKLRIAHLHAWSNVRETVRFTASRACKKRWQ